MHVTFEVRRSQTEPDAWDVFDRRSAVGVGVLYHGRVAERLGQCGLSNQ
jgi:hypothetical protein